MEPDQKTHHLRTKILKVALFIALVVVFSTAAIFIRNYYGSTVGFGVTLVFVPVILKLVVTKVRSMYSARNNSGQ